jgi:hypothetical protein
MILDAEGLADLESRPGLRWGILGERTLGRTRYQVVRRLTPEI